MLACEIYQGLHRLHRGNGTLRVRRGTIIGKRRPFENVFGKRRKIRQETVFTVCGHKYRLRARHYGRPQINLIERVGHQHDRLPAIFRFGHGGQRDHEERFPGPGYRDHHSFGIDHIFGQPVTPRQPACNGGTCRFRATHRRVF